MPEQAEVLLHDRDLHVRIEGRGEVEEIAADRDEIVSLRLGEKPVELLQRIMQIGDEEEAHGTGPHEGGTDCPFPRAACFPEMPQSIVRNSPADMSACISMAQASVSSDDAADFRKASDASVSSASGGRP